MNKYSIDFEITRDVKANGKNGKRRTGSIIVTASSETAAKHKFYQKHKPTNGFWITDIELMKSK